MSALDWLIAHAPHGHLYGDDDGRWTGEQVWAAREAMQSQACAELTHLRACESWILEHAQHGANCMAGADRKYPCTCGLAKIMEEMP